MMWQLLERGKGRNGHRLAGTELFCDLGERELRIVEAFAHERQFLPGEVVFDAGEEGQALYLVVSGRVAIHAEGTGDKPLAELASGAFFGEMGLLDGAPRSAQVRAIESTTLVVLPRTDFDRLMAAHARIASCISLQLARHLGRRLRTMLETAPARGNP
jgi:CRP/FNR family transcriptional regulator, cyclic AMP receptor protein